MTKVYKYVCCIALVHMVLERMRAVRMQREKAQKLFIETYIALNTNNDWFGETRRFILVVALLHTHTLSCSAISKIWLTQIAIDLFFTSSSVLRKCEIHTVILAGAVENNNNTSLLREQLKRRRRKQQQAELFAWVHGCTNAHTHTHSQTHIRCRDFWLLYQFVEYKLYSDS